MSATTKRKRLETIPLSQRGAFKLKEACAYLGGIAPVSVRRLIKRGELKRHPGFRHIVIARVECDRWLSAGDQKRAA